MACWKGGLGRKLWLAAAACAQALQHQCRGHRRSSSGPLGEPDAAFATGGGKHRLHGGCAEPGQEAGEVGEVDSAYQLGSLGCERLKGAVAKAERDGSLAVRLVFADPKKFNRRALPRVAAQLPRPSLGDMRGPTQS